MVRIKEVNQFDIERFRKAVQLMVEKHSILRTSFNYRDYDIPLQIVHRSISYEVPFVDISSFSRMRQEQELNIFLEEQRNKPFVLNWRPFGDCLCSRQG